jgi:DNA-directed RNA polymerase specialized sigma24 family protein
MSSKGGVIESARNGQSWASDEIMRLIRELARYVCGGRSIPGAPEIDWEDLAQEASRRFFQKGIHQYQGTGSERAYPRSTGKSAPSTAHVILRPFIAM